VTCTDRAIAQLLTIRLSSDETNQRDSDQLCYQLPPTAKIAKLIGDLGIDDKTHVVIYHHGKNALDMGSATRVYWTMKVLGHDNVSILNGGYLAYAAVKGNKTTNELASEFGVHPRQIQDWRTF